MSIDIADDPGYRSKRHRQWRFRASASIALFKVKDRLENTMRTPLNL
jgi:hypothetical protein